jgi:hypothetical protein
MLRTLRDHGHITRAQFEEYYKIDSERREEELFGNLAEGKAAAGAAADNARRPNKLGKKLIPSDRFRLLRLEAIKK